MYKKISTILAGFLCLPTILFAGCSSHKHKLSFVEAQAATCQSEGISAHWRCTECEEIFSDSAAKVPLETVIVPRTEHDLSAPKISRNSCEESGEEIRICRRCKEEFITLLEPGEHVLRSYETSAPDCLTEGERTYVCINCSYSKTETVPPLGRHTFSENNVCKSCGFACNPSNGLCFTAINEGGAIVGYSVSAGTAAGNVVLPYYHEALPVLEIAENGFKGTALESLANYAPLRKIGANAFEECTRLTEISLPDTLLEIGNDAFSACISLGAVKIPDSVQKIGKRAFYACSYLTEIFIGKGVTLIDSNAFRNCERLKRISVSEENGMYSGEGNCLIERATSKLLLGCAESAIPDDVTTIGEASFFGNLGLRKIVIPASVTVIGDFAFRDCINLAEIVFEGSSEQWEQIQKGIEWDLYTAENLKITFLG